MGTRNDMVHIGGLRNKQRFAPANRCLFPLNLNELSFRMNPDLSGGMRNLI
jgi:ABC-type taurine transport system ATPase subunit